MAQQRRKLGTCKVKTALHVLCGLYTKQDVLRLLSSDISTWDETIEKRAFKKTGSSEDAIIIEVTNDAIAISGSGYAENLNLQALGSKGQGYIEKPQYSIGIDPENYKNARLAIPDLNRTMAVYEVTEDFDPTSKGILFDYEDPEPIDLSRTYIVYEDENDETQHVIVNNSICTPYNCEYINQYIQQGQNPVFDTKAQFTWKANVNVGTDLWNFATLLANNNIGTNGYKFIKGSYKINCRVYDSLSKAERNNPEDSENATDETDEDSARDYTELYLKSTVYRSVNSTRTNKSKVEEHEWRFKVAKYDKDGNEIDKWNRTVIGFVRDGETGHYNLAFLNNPNKVIEKITLDGVEQPIGTFPWLTPLTTYTENKEDVIQDQTYYYWSSINTNMYIFDTLAHAQDALEGLMDGLVKTFQGDDLVNMEMGDNDLAFNTNMSDCFIMGTIGLHDLANRFNYVVTDNGKLIPDLFIGLSLHQNPIDCNIDLFEMPFDLNDFCETEDYTVKFSPDITPDPEPTNGTN